MTKQEKLKHIAKHIASYYSDEIWTSVNIGDCLDWMDILRNSKTAEEWSNDLNYPSQNKIIDLWKSKRLPIDSQNEDCIDYIYSLIK